MKSLLVMSLGEIGDFKPINFEDLQGLTGFPVLQTFESFVCCRSDEVIRPAREVPLDVVRI